MDFALLFFSQSKAHTNQINAEELMKMLLTESNTGYSFFKTLLHWDTDLFIKINSQWVCSFFDWLMPIMREPANWIPLYVFLLIFAFYKWGWRKALPWTIFAALAPAYGDIISSHGIKVWVGRLRPCNEPKLIPYFRDILHHCGANGSFTSSHAVNHFAMATFFFFTLRPYFKSWSWLFFLWASIVSYAQVYVGVHYPGDVLCGALLGILIGRFIAFVFNYNFSGRK